jgi:hypothetical protein
MIPAPSGLGFKVKSETIKKVHELTWFGYSMEITTPSTNMRLVKHETADYQEN